MYDFDGYSIKIGANKTVTFTPSSNDILKQYGNQLRDYVNKELALNVSIDHDCRSLTVSLANVDITDNMCHKLATLKQTITVFPLYLACNEFHNKTNLQLIYSIRPNEQISIQSCSDKLLVTISVSFDEPTDEVIAKVIHQVCTILII